jgi:sarcosine oxidase subunit beta
MTTTAEIVICGAGIAGIAAAYELVVRRRQRGVVLVDERPPMSLTSDKSTEAYRNWWPGPDGAMVQLMNASIDRLEALAHDSGNIFRLNRRGYVYATADPGRVAGFRQAAESAQAQGAGPLRVDDYAPANAEGFAPGLSGADLLLDRALIRRHFPYLSEQSVAVIHARRAGWFSSTEFGGYLLEQARAAGLSLVSASLTAVDTHGGQVRGVQLSHGEEIACSVFVDAAGPYAAEAARLVGSELPLFAERHQKLAFHDHLGVVPREAPMLIWADPQRLDWSDEEREALAEDPATQALVEMMPAGAHLRPEGGSGSDTLLMLWAYDAHAVPVVFPPEFDPMFAEVVLRGLMTLAPGLRRYRGHVPRPSLDGGYYVKTRENRLLAGPLPMPGAYVLAGLSGYGLMAASAGASLLADHITRAALPPYAAEFSPARYQDPADLQRGEQWDDSGQL